MLKVHVFKQGDEYICMSSVSPEDCIWEKGLTPDSAIGAFVRTHKIMEVVFENPEIAQEGNEALQSPAWNACSAGVVCAHPERYSEEARSAAYLIQETLLKAIELDVFKFTYKWGSVSLHIQDTKAFQSFHGNDRTALALSAVKYILVAMQADRIENTYSIWPVSWSVVGPSTCPLCWMYKRSGDPCAGCPVYKDTLEQYCIGTPYTRVAEIVQTYKEWTPSDVADLAIEEADYLFELLVQQ